MNKSTSLPHIKQFNASYKHFDDFFTVKNFNKDLAM
jgi:hypothetical protein